MSAARCYTAAELLAAGLPALPTDKGALHRLILREGWRQSPLAREEAGGWTYHLSLLPAEAQAELLKRELVAKAQNPSSGPSGHLLPDGEKTGGAWDAFERLPEKAKQAARERLSIVDQVMMLRASGMKAGDAVALVARRADISGSTLWGWLKLIEGAPRADWLALLAPRHKGRTATADCDPRAWDFLVADYMRPERPSFSACHRRLVEAAAASGWGPIPAAKTLERRLAALPQGVRILARQGKEALGRLYPHQTRDRSGFAAMEAVNADGHMFDVFVRFEDGSIGRPVMVGVQDLASGMVLGWRVAATENWTAVRHAFADAIGRFGIMRHAWLDNGRAFASKWLTGGQKSRYRFTVRDDEPAGILTQLGVAVHWTTPYHGQSKPIERAWRDLAEEISRHPECAGAYTGNTIAAKPENYASRAIPIAQFRALVHREIVRHNGRTGRQGGMTRGRSFAELFAESYERDMAWTRATAAQHRMLLLAAEGVTCRKPTGEIQLGGNRYWAEEMAEWIGRQVVVRFDPDDLHAAVGIYARDGRLICEAPCIEAVGFDDAAAAQDHARNKRAWLRTQKQTLALERRLGIDAVAGLIASTSADAAPTPTLGAAVRQLPVPDAPRAPRRAETSSDSHFSRAIRDIAGAAGDDAQILPFRREAG